MQNFRVELKKVVDDSYDVQIGRNLIPALVCDMKEGLVGKIHKFAVVTDSNVEKGGGANHLRGQQQIRDHPHLVGTVSGGGKE